MENGFPDAATIAATKLFDAFETGKHVAPVRDILRQDIGQAYQSQLINLNRWLALGRLPVGRKIGLTTETARKTFKAMEPTCGFLFSDAMYGHQQVLPLDLMSQPIAEVEIAFRMASDITSIPSTRDEVAKLIGAVLPAVEIAGSRVREWDVQPVDMIADNASAGLFVLGQATPWSEFSPSDMPTVSCYRNGDCLDMSARNAWVLPNALSSTLWLAQKAIQLGRPLLRDEIILTGSILKPFQIHRDDLVRVEFAGLGVVEFSVG